MSYKIEKVGVLGSGVMGAGIAAHLANAGIRSYMLDIVPSGLPANASAAERNKFAAKGLETALKASPAAFYTPKQAELITVGNFEDDWAKLAECDWIIEVVVEKLEIKRDVFKRLAEVVGPNTIISSNTSGISLASMMNGMPEDFQRRFLITHFFNPPRYMKLMEMVAGEKTDPELVEFMKTFFSEKLGKGVVMAKDTPNFIANRIGIYGMAATLKRMQQFGLKVEEVDAVLGRPSGRPKSAAFRTSDLVGLDTSLHVMRNVYDNATTDDEREIFQIPDVLQKMAENKMLGDKTGQGFYKKARAADGSSKIQVLDLDTLEYRDQIETPLADTKLEEAARRSGAAKRIETLAYLEDRAGEFAWNLMVDTLLYTAKRMPEIADDILTVDNAMKWGYNWDLGIFEMWDAINPLKSVQRMRKEGREIPEWIIKFINQGQDFFYIEQNGKRKFWDFKEERYRLIPENPKQIKLSKIKQDKSNVLRTNESASLLNIGDGVLLLEFHSKMNAIDEKLGEMGFHALETLNGSDKYSALVISNEADDFSVGANLFEAMMVSNQGKWADLEKAVKSFQDLTMAIKFSAKPVVVAPFGRTLGGGAEIVMAGARVRAHGETYIGLVEVGAGLIPGGGGCKELLVRHSQRMRGMGGPFPPVQKAFETISMAKVATSAEEARALGFLRKDDKISLSRELLINDAKADALELVANGYKAPQPAMLRLPGEGGRLAIEQVIEGMVATKQISEHDALIGRKLAYILTGGDDADISKEVSEQYLLDLEREVFIFLCKQPKTQERMQYILMKGKPLRN